MPTDQHARAIREAKEGMRVAQIERRVARLDSKGPIHARPPAGDQVNNARQIEGDAV